MFNCDKSQFIGDSIVCQCLIKKESLTIGVKGLCDIGVNNRGSTILCRFWLLLNISYNYHRSDNSAFGAVATFSFFCFCQFLFVSFHRVHLYCFDEHNSNTVNNKVKAHEKVYGLSTQLT